MDFNQNTFTVVTGWTTSYKSFVNYSIDEDSVPTKTYTKPFVWVALQEELQYGSGFPCL